MLSDRKFMYLISNIPWNDKNLADRCQPVSGGGFLTMCLHVFHLGGVDGQSDCERKKSMFFQLGECESPLFTLQECCIMGQQG